MESNNITDKDIVIGDKKLKYISQRVQENITKKLILERSISFFQNENQANQFVNHLYNNRNAVVKNSIKIIENKRK